MPSFAIHRFEEIDSTNTWLLDAARAGAPEGTVAVADFQRAGRGRMARTWEAPRGAALLCSVLLRPSLAVADRHLATVAVSLAALDACRDVGVEAGLKWPNDIVVDDRKLAGILAETDGEVDAEGRTGIVVGMGLNITWPGPPDAAGTSIAAVVGSAPARDELLDRYLAALLGWAAALERADSRAALAGAYRDRLVTIGRTVRVELAGRTLGGVARDVTDEGLLVVETGEERVSVAAGDVVHLR